MKTILTVGTFDLLHYGHLALFKRCLQLVAPEKGRLVVGLNTDEFVQQYKNQLPAMNYVQRYRALQCCVGIDYVARNDSACLRPLLHEVQPDILAVGSDWAAKDYYAQIGVSQEELDQKDIQLVYLPYTAGISSTELRTRLLEQGT